MSEMSNAKKISLCAMCTALCYVLPMVFHAVGLGSILSPMHIPVLLCGIVCGGWPGFWCGLIGPLISSLLSGMPPLVMLMRMVPELCAYGIAGGLLMKILHSGNLAVDVYISLTAAMIIGRIIGGIASAVFYTVTSGVYSLKLWAVSYFAESLPGILAHMIFVPLLVFTLEKAKVIPVRYPKINV